MTQVSFRAHLPVLLFAATLGLLVYVLIVRLELGVVRYFDADEFAYLHWAHNVASGVLPYRDFLSYVPPGFVYMLAPLFWLTSGSIPLIAGRVFAFIVFVGICAALGGIAALLRGSKFSLRDTAWFVLLPGTILTFLPLPADKFVEIRPDNLAILCALSGLFFQMLAWRYSPYYRHAALASGMLYGVSLLVLPKTLPQVGVAAIMMGAWWVWAGVGSKRERWMVLRSWVAGMCIPFGVFALWAGVVSGGMGGIAQMIYSLTRLPLEVNRIGEVFGMQPDLFFYPNTVYYGVDGWSIGLIINHIIWFVGLITAAFRLVTPFTYNGRSGVWGEILVAASSLSYVVIFMYGYPLRHAQYLIPVAAFVALYAADAVFAVWRWSERGWVRAVLFVVCFVILGAGMAGVYGRVNRPKLRLTNTQDLRVVSRMRSVIPKGAYVLDLVGATIYYRDPYYVCCVPFGQWEPYLSRPLPDLVTALEQTDTRYIYQGVLGRVSTLTPKNQAYIRAHFLPYNGDSGLLVRRE